MKKPNHFRFLPFVFLAFLGQTGAQIGSLDLSFSSDGKVTTNFGSGDDGGQSVAIQGDGKIVVAGYADVGGISQFALVRYNTDGLLDNSFSGDGKVTTDMAPGSDFGYAVALQSDNKIVVVGLAGITSPDFGVARFNTDGSLDNSFSGDGKTTTHFGFGDDIAYAVAIQSDGKIVVGGRGRNAVSEYDMAVARYNTDGSLDNTFDSDGMRFIDLGSNVESIYAIAIQPADQKVVVAGSYQDGTANADFAVARLNPDGSLDNSFDTDGKVITDFGFGADIARSVKIQSDGKIVAAGYATNGSNQDLALARYNAAGSLDNAFDSDGTVLTDFGSGDDLGIALALQTDGKMLVAGLAKVGINTDCALARYNADGSLDNTFDTDGLATTDFGGNGEAYYGIAIQSDNQIVTAGYTCTGSDCVFAAARYNSSAALPVELVTFCGETVGQGAKLRWSTASERQNRGFYVERSIDALRFEAIGFVEAANGGSGRSYSFLDKKMSRGTNYYRLRQIDRDGGESFSNIAALLAQAEKPSFRVFPNPVLGGSARIEPLGGEMGEETAVALFSADGKLIKTSVFDSGAAFVETSGLADGLYFLEIRTVAATGRERLFVKN